MPGRDLTTSSRLETLTCDSNATTLVLHASDSSHDDQRLMEDKGRDHMVGGRCVGVQGWRGSGRGRFDGSAAAEDVPTPLESHPWGRVERRMYVGTVGCRGVKED